MYLFRKLTSYFLGVLLLFVACFTIFNTQTVQAFSSNISIVKEESISKEIDQQNAPSTPLRHPKVKLKKVLPTKRWCSSSFTFYRQNVQCFAYILLSVGISSVVFIPIASNFSNSLLSFLSLHILM